MDRLLIALLALSTLVPIACNQGSEVIRGVNDVDPEGVLFWAQVQELKPADASSYMFFGSSVAISGNTAIIGASDSDEGDENSGAAYIFARDEDGDGVWYEAAKLLTDSPTQNGYFGLSVALDGETAVIGARGEGGAGYESGIVHVFQKDTEGTGLWTRVAKLQADDGTDDQWFGQSVSISGDTIAVGAPGGSWPEMPGSVYIFDRNLGGEDAWGKSKKITPANTHDFDWFGLSLSLKADVLAVGAPEYVYSETMGMAHVFYRDEGGIDNWGQVASLTGSDPHDGDLFGVSISLDNDVIAVGARGTEEYAWAEAGAAFVFERDQGGSNAWGEQRKLVPSDSQAGDFFGSSLSVDGDRVLVGENRDFSEGAAYLFERDLGGAENWGERERLTESDSSEVSLFGVALFLQDDTALISAPSKWDSGNKSGVVYVFDFLDLGDICGDPSACVSGYCVDNVCCNTACGDGATDDCMACSIAGGSHTDGVCSVVSDETQCDDGDPHTEDDICIDGVCAGSPFYEHEEDDTSGDTDPLPEGDEIDDSDDGCWPGLCLCTFQTPGGNSVTRGLLSLLFVI